MIYYLFRIFLLALPICLFATGCASYPEIYPPTPVAVIEEREFPEMRYIEAESKEDYFKYKSYELMHSKLSEYCRVRKLGMTLPLEAEIGLKKNLGNSLRFSIGPDAKDRELKDSSTVKVRTKPKRTVISIGARGAYTPKNLDKTLKDLQDWMDEKPEYVRKAAPYYVFWNSIFTPWILKRYEIHIEVEKIVPPDEEKSASQDKVKVKGISESGGKILETGVEEGILDDPIKKGKSRVDNLFP